MTMRMSIPVDGIRTARKPRIPDTVQRVARLFFRNLWRSGAMLVMPFIIAIGVWFTSTMLRPGIVLWHDVSLSVSMSYAVVGPLCAAVSAWTAGRAHRRKMDDQLRSTSLPGWQQDLLTLATASGIGVIGYGGIVLVVLGWAATQATWGAPYGVALLSGLLMVVLFCLFGAAVGMLWPHHFASILVLAVTGGSVAFGNTIQNWGAEANARELTLWNTLLSLRDGFSEWEARRVAPELYENMLMATGVSALIIMLVLVIRHRGPFVTGALVIAMAWAAAGVIINVTGDRSDLVANRMVPETTASFEYSCTGGGAVEICLHPAWTALEGDVMQTASTFYAPIEGLDNVPKRLVQTSLNGNVPNEGQAAFQLSGGSGVDYQLLHSLQTSIFPELNTDITQLSDAEQVISGWLMQQAGGRPMFHMLWGTAPQESIVAQEQELLAAVDRFDAIAPEEQRAWLEVNWDALRVGELTLEDLP